MPLVASYSFGWGAPFLRLNLPMNIAYGRTMGREMPISVIRPIRFLVLIGSFSSSSSSVFLRIASWYFRVSN